MSQPFLITGLPRSRTAWFSVAATSDRSLCHHEPTRITASFDDLKALWQHPTHEYVGMSDSALGLQLGRILAEIEPRVVMVLRPPADVLGSLKAFLQYDEAGERSTGKFVANLWSELNRWHTHPLVKAIAFEDLRDYAKLIDCFEWLMPHGRFEHVHSMARMNVQVTREALEASLKAENAGGNFWWRT